MRLKKVRGHRRIWREIEAWKHASKALDIELLQQRERDYVKIWVHPFSSISMLNSAYPEPSGETRKRIVQGLFEIYNHWKDSLDSLNQPYYLKIWLYEPRISKSQVVCAIGSAVDFYETTFGKPDHANTFDVKRLGIPLEFYDGMTWEHRLDEAYFDLNDLGSEDEYHSKEDFVETKKWYANRLKKPHKMLGNSNNATKIPSTLYSYTLGNVWIGSR